METNPRVSTVGDVHYQTISVPNIHWVICDCKYYPLTGKLPGRSKSRKHYVKTYPQKAIEIKQLMESKRDKNKVHALL